jgi:aldehyde:ferredoxin oxidoreductase
MDERYGYWNRVLHVNLMDRDNRVEEPGDRFFSLYGGGRGIIAHYLLKHVPQGAGPFGPEDVLVFAPGVLLSETLQRLEIEEDAKATAAPAAG